MNTSTDTLLAELQNLDHVVTTSLEDGKDTTSVPNSLTPTPTLPTSQNFSTSATNLKQVPMTLTDDNLNEFILKHSQELVQNSLIAIQELKDIVGKTFDGKLITSFADMVKATTGALDTLNSIQLEKNKQKASKEMKLLDIESRKNLKVGPSKVVNNNVLVATREEIFKMLSQGDTPNPIESRLIEHSDEPKVETSET